MATADWRQVIHGVRVAVIVVLEAVVVNNIVGEQLGGLSHSILWVLPVVLFNTEFHVGETLEKVTNNIVATIVGGTFGYGLRWCSDNLLTENHKHGFNLFVIFTLVILVVYSQSIERVKEYGINFIAFLLVSGGVLLSSQAPNWLADRSLKKVIAFVSSFAIIVILSFIPAYWAGVDAHDRIREHIDTLAIIFKELAKEGFGENSASEDFQGLAYSKSVQDLIDSKDKENSLIKSMGWELPWRCLRKQYGKIGDQIRHCAFTIQSLSTYLTKCSPKSPGPTEVKGICSEVAKALENLSIEHMTPPAASNDIIGPLNNILAAKNIASRLEESVIIIKELTNIIKKLAHLNQFGQDILISVTSESPQRSISVTQQEVVASTNHLVALIKISMSWLPASLMRFKIKLVSVLNGPNLIQLPLNSVPPQEAQPDHAAMDIHESPASPV